MLICTIILFYFVLYLYLFKECSRKSNCNLKMSLYRSFLLFPSTSTNSGSPRVPLRAHSPPASLTRFRLGCGRRILKLRASPRLLCSSAMAIDDGPTSPSSSLQVISLSFSRYPFEHIVLNWFLYLFCGSGNWDKMEEV